MNRMLHTRGLFITVSIALFTAVPVRGDEHRSLPGTDVFVSGSGGYHTYRIPSLLVTQKGTLLAFCEGRKTSRSDHGDVDLLLRRSEDGGKAWNATRLVYEEGDTQEITIGNPCPVVDRSTGVIWLPFCRDNRDVLVTHSNDDGRTWSKPVDITGNVKRPDWGWYATGPGVGIQLRREPYKGRLIIPCDHREEIDGQPVMFSHVFYSDDYGRSWKLGGSVAKHTDECQVVELGDGRQGQSVPAAAGSASVSTEDHRSPPAERTAKGGRLLINMRNYWGRDGGIPAKGSMRAVALSSDGGDSWKPLRFDKTLIEPVCQASLIRVSEPGVDARLLFSNPASAAQRHRLTVRLSQDEGSTWPVSKLIYQGSAAYSCLAMLPDGRVGLLYERDDYARLTFTSFSLEGLTPP